MKMKKVVLWIGEFLAVVGLLALPAFFFLAGCQTTPDLSGLPFDLEDITKEVTTTNIVPSVSEPSNDPEPEADEFATAEFHTCPKETAKLQIVSSLSVEIRGSKLYLTTDKPELWPDVGDGTIGNIHCLLFRDGKWHCGPIDGMRPFQRNGGDRSVKCGAVPDGDNRLYEAVAGERVGFVITPAVRNKKTVELPGKRTAVGWVIWK